MPNIALTDYIVKDNIENLEKINRVLRDLTEEEQETAMLSMFQYLGIDTENQDIRGEIITFDLDNQNQTLYMTFATAWDWQPDFVTGLKSKFPDMEIYFACEESMAEVFETNSFQHFPTRFIINDNNGTYEYFVTFDKVLEYVNKWFDNMDFSTATTIQDVQEIFHEWNFQHFDADCQYYLHIFKEIK